MQINFIGIGCQCVEGWRVIQDVGYYRRSGGRAHGDSLDRNGDSGLKCEVNSFNLTFN